jgi:enterobactin synthetase component D
MKSIEGLLHDLFNDPRISFSGMLIPNSPEAQKRLLTENSDLLKKIPNWPKEAQLARKVSFLAGRLCAKNAIQNLSSDSDGVVKIKNDRAPHWPEGFVGSISHTDRLACAAVSISPEIQSIGIDLQKLVTEEKAQKLSPKIFTAKELNVFYDFSESANFSELFTIGFSFKESVYKALYPLEQRFIAFSEFEITGINPSSGLVEGLFDAKELSGKYTCHQNLIATGLLLT